MPIYITQGRYTREAIKGISSSRKIAPTPLRAYCRRSVGGSWDTTSLLGSMIFLLLLKLRTTFRWRPCYWRPAVAGELPACEPLSH